MILPAKHLRRDRALLDVGAEVLAQLDERRSVSEVWHRVQESHLSRSSSAPISFDWFILSLSFLYSISAIELTDGLIMIGAPR
jgi:ABC-3C biological conflict system middle component